MRQWAFNNEEQAEHLQNVRSDRTEGEKGGLDLVLAAEPVARG
jgi:hypothetical protein